ncbi:polymorphic toxin-type HINT domain-containing protein [Spirillospora sp. CA-294931]|uniref:polymorphic toxin-type HINT domain-containing protein n=1 Tax=Spirillospora sp. CA-294931 TaxID=3240042 RepID=UPI003D8DA25C
MPSVRAGSLPVWVGGPQTSGQQRPRVAPPGKVKVELLDIKTAKKAGLDGVLLRVGAASDGRTDPVRDAQTSKVSLRVDYNGFRNARGASWAQRLRLVRLPDCALTNSGDPNCQPQPVAGTRNDARSGQISADVDLALNGAAPAMFAVAAGASGPSGDFAATPLSPSSTWQVSNQAGSFNWSYPIRTVPSVSGPTPKVGLSYSSSSVDGRTSSTNNQTSWLGEGFDYWPGYIERKYKTCSDDGQSGNPPPGDQCWGGFNATMSLNGNSVELIQDATSGAWRPKTDDGSKIERLTGVPNGDDNGEHWRVTVSDGTQYYFGLNRLPKWATGNPETKSTWTVPVAGDDANEPCNKSTGFKDSFCNQAWRWNLDYVVDPRGNAMSLWYGTETNYYAKNKVASPGTPYVRGGYLTRIDYGLRHDTIFSAKAPQQTVFDVQERCFKAATECTDAKFTLANKANWPDVPVDQHCAKDATCTNKFSPTFWTRKRLAGISTQVLNGTSYKPVDSWEFDQSITAAGDTSDPSLRLNGITHKGKVSGANIVGGEVALPKIKFGYSQMPNRVDGIGDSLPAFIKWRLTGIENEHGGATNITYSGVDCTKASYPTPETNTRLCFPQRTVRPGATDPNDLITDWMHKYVVKEVNNADYVGGAPAEITHYEYLDAPAWHFADDDALTPARYKTWSEWRGYSKVRTLHGGNGTPRTRTDHLYFRGMDGDRSKADGSATKPPVKIVDSEGTEIADRDHLQGFLREKISYKQESGGELSGTINTPWDHGPTAKRGDNEAWRTDTAKTRTRTALSAPDAYRRTEVVTDFNDDGTVKQEWDKGDVGAAAGGNDDLCTKTTYTANATKGIWGLPDRTWAVSKPCDQTPSFPNDAVSDVKTTYDLNYGEPTKTEEADGYTDGEPNYVATTRTVYDGLGRQSETYDALNNKTTTGYTSAGGVVTGRTVTNALNQSSTQTLEPAWGLPTLTKDANGNSSTMHYDAIGRLIKAWGPGRPTDRTPNAEFTYQVSAAAPTAITAKELMPNGQQKATHQLYDGQLRPRQTQAPATATGRVLTDTYYDARGLAWKTNHPYLDKTGAPGTTLLTPVQDNSVPRQTLVNYDGAERPTASTLYSFATKQWGSTVAYGGDRTTVTPPRGGTLTTTITNARGKSVELRQHKSGTVSDDPATYDATKYTYTPAGELATVTDPAGNQWKYTHDLRGRKTAVDDPDKGLTKLEYNAAGGLTKSTDAENRVLKFSYDALGRKTFQHQVQGDGTETKLAEWTYDQVVGGLGMPSASIRWVGDQAYKQEVTKYDAAYRPLESQVTIPAAEGNLAKTYQTKLTYNFDGSLDTHAMPAAGDLAAETVSYGYDNLGRATTTSGLDGYAKGAAYTDFGELSQLSLGTYTSKWVWLTNYYDNATRRLIRSRTDRENVPSADADINYTYDPAGNVTKVADTPATGPSDVQCFTSDHLQRLTQAWTATDDCAQAPTKDNAQQILGGAQPYWQSYSYDAIGNRTKSTNHDVTGDTTKDRTNAYTYNGNNKGQPHTLTSVSTTWGGPGVPESGTSENTYDYDKTGNTTNRRVGGDDQKLTWDAEGRIAKVTQPDGNGGTKTSTYLHDANGNQLIRRDSDGTSTLFLDGQELKLQAGGVTGTRYYNHGDSVIAVRTAKGLTWLMPDRQGSAQIAIDAKTQEVQRRRYLPFGQLRTDPSTWPGTKAFVGGTPDPNTKMLSVGAREYDPDTGRFASVDPIFQPGDPQAMNGYAYAGNTPVTKSDASGLRACAQPSECQNTSPRITNDTPRNQNQTYYPDLIQRGRELARRQVTNQVQILNQQAKEMRARVDKAQARVINAVKVIAKIAADELGITAGFDCLTKGDLGACGETLLNIITSAAGGFATKLLAKYANPFKWKKAGALLKRLANAVSDIAGGIKDWFKANRGIKAAEQAAKTAQAAADAVPTGCNSFTQGTRVRLANGKTKPIEKIKPGDRVLSTNPKTRSTEARSVVAAYSGTRYNGIIQITIAATKKAGGSGLIYATEHHRFWSLTAKDRVHASQLSKGSELLSPDGLAVRVQAAIQYSGDRTVYDLTVAEYHSFYVTAGSISVLAHNDKCPVTGRSHGRLGEGASSDALAAGGYTDIVSEVSFRNSAGKIFRPDFVARDPSGNWVAIDAKTGTGRLTDNQMLGYPELQGGGARLATDKLEGLGFNHGDVMSMRVEFDIWKCPDCNP